MSIYLRIGKHVETIIMDLIYEIMYLLQESYHESEFRKSIIMRVLKTEKHTSIVTWGTEYCLAGPSIA